MVTDPSFKQIRFMGDHDEQAIVGEILKQFEHFGANGPIKTSGWFIQQQHLWAAQQLHG
jgi:hypothetical protein